MLLIFFFFAAAIFVGMYLHADPGYLLIAYQKWTIEMPLWFAIVALLILWMASYLFFRLVHHIIYFPQYISQKKYLFNLKRNQQLTTKGLINFAEGQWKKAEKSLIKATYSNSTKQDFLINYLAAANAAHHQKAYSQRDYYLQQAQKNYPKSKFTIAITLANFQLEAKQYREALIILRSLYDENPVHSYVLKLLQKIYEEEQDWQNLQALLPLLRKYVFLNKIEFKNFSRTVYLGVLQEAKFKKNLESLHNSWFSLPHDLRKEPKFIESYVTALINNNAISEAEKILRTTLKKHWDSSLVRLYGIAIGGKPQKQLALAESWLPNYSEDAVLLLTLGRLCKHNQLWGKAKTYIKNSLMIEPSAAAYSELAEILEKLGEKEEAAQYYRQGFLFLQQYKKIKEL